MTLTQFKGATSGKLRTSVEWKGKRYLLPFNGANYGGESYDLLETVQNPYSGESVSLPYFAVAVYDIIKGSEMIEDWTKVRKGSDWFQRHFAKEYMVLLD